MPVPPCHGHRVSTLNHDERSQGKSEHFYPVIYNLPMFSKPQYIPTESEVIKAINRVFRVVIGGFSSMENAELRRCVKFDNPTWSLSETRLKGIKTRGMADGRWKQPWWSVELDFRLSKELIKKRDAEYTSAKRWKDAPVAEVGELCGTFDVKSGKFRP